MKKKHKQTWGFALLILSLSGIFSFILLYGHQHRFSRENESSVADRNSITFIMGKDKPGSSYYALATEHFALDAKEKTDIVYTACQTLACVLEKINNSPQKWSQIHIVAHGNPKTGLNLFIDHEGHKATPKRLLQASLFGTLPKLDSTVVDTGTHIQFWSCGIGQSLLMTTALKSIFSTGSIHGPKVNLSPDFVVFAYRADNRVPARISARYYPYYYRRAHRPSDLEIEQSMKNQYGEASVRWREALHHHEPTSRSSTYSMEYHLPIQYTKLYNRKADRPRVSEQQEKILWIQQQSEIMKQLEDIDLPLDSFHWQVDKVLHKKENGEIVPAIRAIGMTTVLCFLDEREV